MFLINKIKPKHIFNKLALIFLYIDKINEITKLIIITKMKRGIKQKKFHVS